MINNFSKYFALICTLLFCFFCATAADEVDPSLLQLCSAQLKLLQLYTDMQQLQSAENTEACSDNVCPLKR